MYSNKRKILQSRPINWPLLTIESPVAQWLEHPTRPRRVVGSNPIWGLDFFRVLQTFNLSCVCCFIYTTFASKKHFRILIWKIVLCANGKFGLNQNVYIHFSALTSYPLFGWSAFGSSLRFTFTWTLKDKVITNAYRQNIVFRTNVDIFLESTALF